MKKLITCAVLALSTLASAHDYEVAMQLTIGQEKIELHNVLNDETPWIEAVTTEELGTCILETRVISSDDNSVTIELIAFSNNNGELTRCCQPVIVLELDKTAKFSVGADANAPQLSLSIVAHKK